MVLLYIGLAADSSITLKVEVIGMGLPASDSLYQFRRYN